MPARIDHLQKTRYVLGPQDRRAVSKNSFIPRNCCQHQPKECGVGAQKGQCTEGVGLEQRLGVFPPPSLSLCSRHSVHRGARLYPRAFAQAAPSSVCSPHICPALQVLDWLPCSDGPWSARLHRLATSRQESCSALPRHLPLPKMILSVFHDIVSLPITAQTSQGRDNACLRYLDKHPPCFTALPLNLA